MNRQCCVATSALIGVEAAAVDVEVDVGAGLPSFSIVGLPDMAVQEARERVRAAVRSSGFELPNARITVNLAPGPMRKHGTGFDLPIALAILGATGQLPDALVTGVHAVGELSLDGTVRRVPGLIAHGLRARARGMPLLAAAGDRATAALEGLEYLSLERLASLRTGLPSSVRCTPGPTAQGQQQDMSEVVGQELAVRALVVAAAGGHNVLMVGPPGAGKTMLARRLPSILPPLGPEERVESALIHSVAGCDTEPVMSGIRPFRSPHHSASIAGLVGGGGPPRPGEASLAHNGVLFLDEMPEFGPAALQCLRQPMEDGRIVLVRVDGRIAFPARFSLVGAANPCPCGFLGDDNRECTCTASQIQRYRSRIGGPLIDRIDLCIAVNRPDPRALLGGSSSSTSTVLRDAVVDARAVALARNGVPNARLAGSALIDACGLGTGARRALEGAARHHHLSGRGVTKVLRVARTIADLEGSERVDEDHLAEAVGYRSGEAR